MKERLVFTLISSLIYKPIRKKILFCPVLIKSSNRKKNLSADVVTEILTPPLLYSIEYKNYYKFKLYMLLIKNAITQAFINLILPRI